MTGRSFDRKLNQLLPPAYLSRGFHWHTRQSHPCPRIYQLGQPRVHRTIKWPNWPLYQPKWPKIAFQIQHLPSHGPRWELKIDSLESLACSRTLCPAQIRSQISWLRHFQTTWLLPRYSLPLLMPLEWFRHSRLLHSRFATLSQSDSGSRDEWAPRRRHSKIHHQVPSRDSSGPSCQDRPKELKLRALSSQVHSQSDWWYRRWVAIWASQSFDWPSNYASAQSSPAPSTCPAQT